ncbi:arylesterase [Parvibaculum sedimenti]
MFAAIYKQAPAAMLCLLLAFPALAAEKPLTLVALGDSLTAGYLLGPDDGFVPQLEKALKARGYHNLVIVNGGVSGDTSSGGLSRLDWTVVPDADAVIVELGANDALRGIDPKLTRQNLEEILTRLQARHLPVLLAGMIAPPNMGADYGKAFNAIYPELAAANGLVFYPFFLDGVAGELSGKPAAADLTLADGIHPNSRGVAIMVARILPKVETLIAEAQKAREKRAQK